MRRAVIFELHTHIMRFIYLLIFCLFTGFGSRAQYLSLETGPAFLHGYNTFLFNNGFSVDFNYLLKIDSHHVKWQSRAGLQYMRFANRLDSFNDYTYGTNGIIPGTTGYSPMQIIMINAEDGHPILHLGKFMLTGWGGLHFGISSLKMTRHFSNESQVETDLGDLIFGFHLSADVQYQVSKHIDIMARYAWGYYTHKDEDGFGMQKITLGLAWFLKTKYR